MSLPLESTKNFIKNTSEEKMENCKHEQALELILKELNEIKQQTEKLVKEVEELSSRVGFVPYYPWYPVNPFYTTTSNVPCKTKDNTNEE